MVTKTIVAIYIRVSTLDQAREGYSLEAQENTMRKWCAERKYEIYDLYADRGISGKDIDHRPDMRRLMHDAKAKKFNLVVFWALSRFTRSVADLYDTLELFNQLNISLFSYTESFDTSTPMGRAMIGIVGIFAQLERELTGERIKAAMLVRAEKGKRTCTTVLGYDRCGKDTFTINPVGAEYVKFCFEKYIERKNLTEVAVLARQKGYVGKFGREPTAWTINVILTRPIYCGYNLYKGNLYKGNHPPLVSVETYNKVQTLLKKQGRITGRTKTKDFIRL